MMIQLLCAELHQDFLAPMYLAPTSIFHLDVSLMPRLCCNDPSRQCIDDAYDPSKELHRDFIAAVFDMGLKKADPSRLKEMLPKKER